MIEVADYYENFLNIIKNNDREVIIYGAGSASRIAFPFLPKVRYFCDKKAENISNINGVEVITPERLSELNQLCYILVCINKKESTFREICEYLEKIGVRGKIFNYFHNIAFNCFQPLPPYKANVKVTSLRIRLISYDDGWILGKFAQKLEDELKKLGVRVDVADCCDPNADINHHISHHKYEPIADGGDTLMITHVDCKQKVELLKHQLKTAKIGICMSKDTLDKLTILGVPREKLCYVNPGQDGIIQPKKYVIGITHKTHEYIDYRKNPRIIIEMCDHISPQYFAFKIMGSGWDDIVENIRKRGFEVDYYNNFDYDIYLKLMPSLDYYLYYGNDEGSMGYLDALAAGVKTIVTPQGYHLDAKGGLTYSCEVVADFIEVLQTLQSEREKIINSVKEWTWENYARKHLSIWKYLTQSESLETLLNEQHHYKDGIYSMLINDISI